MKIFLTSLATISIVIGISIFLFRKETPAISVSEPREIAVCGPVYASAAGLTADGKYVNALPGWGKYSFPISTQVDSAQFYFDQGLNMYYGYHFREAVASFKESARLDPGCPMAYWGQALAMGPYYNAAHLYTKSEEICGVLKKMNETSAKATAKEKSLIAAMNTRYSEDPADSQRAALNAAYAASLKKSIVAFPAEEEMKVLYIDAVMLMHAWDFWKKDGTAKPWTPELVTLCEQVLKTIPKHPAALHYHIHLTEASRNPEVALGSAETLRDLLPGVAHMVHMASHEYERNGLYAKGVEVNNLADDNLVYYDLLAKNLSLNKHSPHYFAVQTYCALTAGMYKDAMRYAQRCQKSVAPTPQATYDQYLYMFPVMTMVRMGKWDEILTDSNQVNSEWTYASLLSDFAKGIASSQTGEIPAAESYLGKLREKINDPILTKRRIPFNSPLQVARIAEKILEGVIYSAQKDYPKAIASLEAAVKLEDALIYTEPKDWPIPSRQFLGACLLKGGKAALAEKVYREDLVYNPGNGWSTLGLYQSLQAQKKTKSMAVYKKKYMEAFAQADQVPVASVLIR